MNNQYHIIGLMSGTSLDGLDMVKCVFQKEKKWSFKMEKSETIPYPKYWEEKLRNLHTKDEKEIEKTSVKYGELLGKLSLEFIKKNNLKCDYISSHGHTIFHRPKLGYTLQIGGGKTISEYTNITTINNFRELDISLGGQGAPLVPIGDLHLFSEYKYCLNLGGFANISSKNEDGTIIAFDICPVNFVINKLSNKLGKSFDNKGGIAKSGTLKSDLLEELNNLSFYTSSSPKSLGREWVEDIIFPILEKYNYSDKDKMNTFCEHIGIQIGTFLKGDSVLVTGGGTFNNYLIERIEHYSISKIIIPNSENIDFKEAIIFAFLGVLKLRNEINCLSSVTGAKRDSSGGDIYLK